MSWSRIGVLPRLTARVRSSGPSRSRTRSGRPVSGVRLCEGAGADRRRTPVRAAISMNARRDNRSTRSPGAAARLTHDEPRRNDDALRAIEVAVEALQEQLGGMPPLIAARPAD